MDHDFWNKNAGAWGKTIQSHLIESRKTTSPAIIKEIIKYHPKSVLDLGCGEGWIASELSPKGIQYKGLDFSSELIKIAQSSYQQSSFEAVSYEDLIQGVWKSPQTFDVVVFNFSLFEENLRPILDRASSLIHRSGIILIQTLHPCTLLPHYQDGWRSEDFKSFPVPLEGTMPWYARTFGTWVRTLASSGLKLKEVSEPIDPVSKSPLSIIFCCERMK